MPPTFPFPMITVAIAFTVGFAVKRGGLCTYVAAMEIATKHSARSLLAFLGAAAWAGVVLIPLSWGDSQLVALSWSHTSLAIALLGGLILGIGTYINQGCFFGTFIHLVRGNLTYMGTLLGLSLGVVVADGMLAGYKPPLDLAPLVADQGLVAALWLATMAILVLVMLFHRDGTAGLVRRNRASISIMFAIGVGGGLLFGSVSGWDYGSVLTQVTRKALDTGAPGPTQLAALSTLGLIAGGITAAIRDGSFRLRLPSWRGFVACTAGGMLMGGAAIMIPGGNDGMLLIGIPSMAPHSLVSFACMLASLIGLFLLAQRMKANPST